MPYVGVTMSISPGKDGGERLALNGAYVDALQWAGATPVMLPPNLTSAGLCEILENLDGVVLSGGGDVEPALYGEAPHPSLVGVSAKRDRFEIEVVRHAVDRRMPLFAICRGMQILNVGLGGTLYQHVPQTFGDAVKHDQVAAGYQRCDVTHPVEVRAGTLLGNLVGSGAVGVNSMHHQAVRALGMHLVPTARASDGVIEAVEAPALGEFVVGVQWHPEELVSSNPAARALFEGFMSACAGGQPAAQPIAATR